MSDVLLDQIEFRWTDRDVSAIASSNPRTQDLWHKRLRGWVRFRDDEQARQVASSSGVYFTFDDGTAALVLRSTDPHALWVYEDTTTDRHEVVARALVGPIETLSAQQAVRLIARCALELTPGAMGATATRAKVLKVPPGQVPIDAHLSPLQAASWQDILGYDASWQEHESRPPGLLQLVDAVLRAPDQPVTFFLDELGGLDLAHSPAPRLLWMLHEVVTPILTDVHGQAAYGWRPTFSTFETPDDRALSALPGVTFRISGRPGVTVVHASSEITADLAGEAARRLIQLFDHHGPAARARVDQAVRTIPGLEDRLRALCGDSRSIPATGTRTSAFETRRERRDKPSADSPYSVQSDESSWQAAGDDKAADGWPGQVSDIQQPGGDSRCLPLYAKLGKYLDTEKKRQVRQESGQDVPPPSQEAVAAFRQTVGWFDYATERNWHLPANEQSKVLRVLAEGGPYLKRVLRTLYGAHASERMAHVLYPLFAAAAQDEKRLSDLYNTAVKHNPDTAEVVPIICRLLGPQRGGDLLAEIALTPPKDARSNDSFSAGQGAYDHQGIGFVSWLAWFGERVPSPLTGALVLTWLLMLFLLVFWR